MLVCCCSKPYTNPRACKRCPDITGHAETVQGEYPYVNLETMRLAEKVMKLEEEIKKLKEGK